MYGVGFWSVSKHVEGKVILMRHKEERVFESDRLEQSETSSVCGTRP